MERRRLGKGRADRRGNKRAQNDLYRRRSGRSQGQKNKGQKSIGGGGGGGGGGGELTEEMAGDRGREMKGGGRGVAGDLTAYPMCMLITEREREREKRRRKRKSISRVWRMTQRSSGVLSVKTSQES